MRPDDLKEQAVSQSDPDAGREGLKTRDVFEFPMVANTGEGEPPYPARSGEVHWAHPTNPSYFVTHQGDRPAVAFRCHYPEGSSPCTEETAREFIEWATDYLSDPPPSAGRPTPDSPSPESPEEA